MPKPSVKKLRDGLPGLKKRIASLEKQELLVGVPSDKAAREGEGLNNATLAYIHDNGSPAANIPARPFMLPGIEAVRREIAKYFGISAKLSIVSGSDIQGMLHKVGMIAQASIRNKINEGIQPPLKEGTLKGRIRKRIAIKGAKAELKHRKSGGEATLTNAKPLIATGQLRNSINYAIRKR